MLKTVKITGHAYHQDGTPASKAKGRATLSTYEIDGGIVVPDRLDFTLDENGRFEMDLWPNERGQSGSSYSVKIYSKSVTVFDVTIVVPDVEHAVEIYDIMSQAPYPPIDSAQQALIGAQKAATEAKASAADAKDSATSASESADNAAESATLAEQSATEAAASADSVQIKEQEREQIFEDAQEGRKNRFDEFLSVSGYQFLGDYAAGIEITEYNQIIRDSDGEFWRLSGEVELPYTTTGAGLPEGGVLVAVGDAALRQELADPGMGAAMVAYNSNADYSPDTVGHELKELSSGVMEAASESRGGGSVATLETTDFVERTETIMGYSGSYVRRASDGRVAVGALCASGKAVEWRLLEDAEGFLMVRGGYVGDSTGAQAFHNASNFTGDFIFTPNLKNSYTVQEGASFEITFTGTTLVLQHLAERRGGLWSVSIDGSDPIVISTYLDGSGTRKTVVATGLEDAEHTAVFTFAGADPDNPPSSGAARGWFNYREDPLSSADYTAFTNTATLGRPRVIDETNEKMVCAYNTVLEFAISSTLFGSDAKGTWVPYHGNAGATRNIQRRVFLDGKELPGGVSDIVEDQGLSSGLIILQTYEGYNTENNVKLFDGAMCHTFTGGKFTVTHRIQYVEDVEQTGYLFQVAANSEVCSILRTPYGDHSISVPSTYKETLLGDYFNSVAFISSSGDEVFAATGSSFYETFSDVKEDLLTAGDLFFSERPDRLTKIYFRKRRDQRVEAGAVDTHTATYVLGGMPGLVDFI